MAKASARTRVAEPVTPSVPNTKVEQVEAVMRTNNYDIVSKRSVEEIYIRDEVEGNSSMRIPQLRDSGMILKHITASTASPIVLQRLHLGSCVDRWDIDYLTEKVGPQKPTIIHAASSATMSFREKNFAYETVPFGDFLTRASSGAHVYMRALSGTAPSKAPANLSADYPELAADFTIPSELAFVKDRLHSSVLRITGNVNMWLHYDVMANILCQIRGSKRVILFPPKDISKLDFPPGETTSNMEIFTAESELLAHCSPVETFLDEGDILFIPACWPHTTAPAGGNFSVATNIFFRSFEQKLYAAGRDVYGNRDLEMYQNGRKTIERIFAALKPLAREEACDRLAALADSIRARKNVPVDTIGAKQANRIIGSAIHLPAEVANFYLARLADEIMACTDDVK